MIVMEVISNNKLKVIHYSGSEEANANALLAIVEGSSCCRGKALVKEEIKMFDPQKEHLEVIEYENHVALHTGMKAIAHARTRLGEDKYNIFTNNCESFANWVITEINASYQGDKALAVLGSIFEVIATKIFVIFAIFARRLLT